jgi:hypothetical protein
MGRVHTFLSAKGREILEFTRFRRGFMLSHLKKGLLFAVLVVASLSAVSTAGATTATITNGPNVTGTSGTTLLKLHNAGVTLSCTGSSSSGTVVASATGTLPLRIGTVTPGFSGCRIVGGLGITVNCQPSALNATAVTTGGHTPGSITPISCHIFVTTQTACRHTVVGAVGARYQNGTPGTLTVDKDHENLQTINSTNGAGAACAVLPNDASARFTDGTNGDAVYTIAPSNLTVNVS